MNHVYKTIWNKTLGRMVVASETARNHGRSNKKTITAREGVSHLSLLTLAVASVMGSASAFAITCTDGSGTNATLCGWYNTASGNQGSAVGYSNTVSGHNKSNAFGSDNAATGESSNAFGQQNTASGYSTAAMGVGNKASNYFSAASGVSNVASGYNSYAAGTYTAAQGYGSTAIGAAGNGNYLFTKYDSQGQLIAINDIPVTVNGSGVITAINGISVTQEQANQFNAAVAKGSAVAFADRSTAVGARNIATGEYSNAVGYDNRAIGYSSVAFGASNTAHGSENVAMGLGNVSTGGLSTAVGTANQATGIGAAAIGYHNQATGSSNAFGYYNTANAVYGQSNAYGIRNNASGDYSSAYGSNNVSAGSRSFAAGSNNLSQGQSATSLGASTGVYSVNAPYDVTNTKIVSLNGIPVTATSQFFSSITAINGISISTTQFDQIFEALRYGGSVAFGTNSITLGAQNFAVGANSMAIGFNNSTGGQNSSVLGVNSIALANNSTALGYDSVADRANTISVGRSGAEKQVVNVAAATQNTDAVNLFQLGTVASALGGGAGFNNGVFTAPTYTIQGANYNNVGSALSAVNVKLDSLQEQIDDFSGSSMLMSTQIEPVTMPDSANESTQAAGDSVAAVAKVGTGTSAINAVNNSTLTPVSVAAVDVLTEAKTYTTQQTQQAVKSANAYTDTRVDALNSRFDAFQSDVDKRFNTQEKKINQTGAISSAFTGMAMNAAGLSGKNRVAVGFGGQGSETAVAVGYQIAPTQNTSVSIGGAISDSTKALSAGVGFSW